MNPASKFIIAGSAALFTGFTVYKYKEHKEHNEYTQAIKTLGYQLDKVSHEDMYGGNITKKEIIELAEGKNYFKKLENDFDLWANGLNKEGLNKEIEKEQEIVRFEESITNLDDYDYYEPRKNDSFEGVTNKLEKLKSISHKHA